MAVGSGLLSRPIWEEDASQMQLLPGGAVQKVAAHALICFMCITLCVF